MSSSDSDNDCYGNITQKLQSLKNKYKEDKIVSKDLLDDSDEVTLDSIIANNSNKRITRSATAKKKSTIYTPPKNTKSRKEDVTINEFTRKTLSLSMKEQTNDQIGEVSGSRNRMKQKRGELNLINLENQSTRKRTSKTRSTTALPADIDIPIISIGNTHEYPDLSHNQQIFNSKPDVVELDDTEIIENEEISIKVCWQSTEYHKFSLRRYQKFTQIYDYFSKKENVGFDKLIFLYNDKIFTPEDTPDSINYNFVKFIEGGITNVNVNCIKKKNRATKGLKLIFRCENSKKPFEDTIGADEKLSLCLLRCAEHLEMPLEKLKFIFDGENLSGTQTPKDLELEGGECIDVKILN